MSVISLRVGGVDVDWPISVASWLVKVPVEGLLEGFSTTSGSQQYHEIKSLVGTLGWSLARNTIVGADVPQLEVSLVCKTLVVGMPESVPPWYLYSLY